MKKIVSLALVLIMALSLTACGDQGGGTSADPTLGKYIGMEFSGDGSNWLLLDEVFDEGESYIELKSGGKGEFCLGGDATDIKWTLESDGVLKLTRDDMESNGTLKDGLITLTDLWGNEVTITFQKEETGDAAQTGDKVLDWWNGDWYGWWEITECAGYYEDVDYTRWDICGNIDIGSDKTGTLTLWDEDFSKDHPMAEVSVTLSESDTGEYGTLTSKSGNFTDVDLASEEWVIDPASAGYENMIVIKGHYESGEDKFNYEIWLRPWGTYWDDVEEKDEPDYYTDWYLPLIKAGKSMPDSVDTDAR